MYDVYGFILDRYENWGILTPTPADIDLEHHTITVNKSYQRISGRDVITPPKTPKSNRTKTIPEFLVADLQDYMNSIYDLQSTDKLLRIF